jgi:hypothetical protein
MDVDMSGELALSDFVKSFIESLDLGDIHPNGRTTI